MEFLVRLIIIIANIYRHTFQKMSRNNKSSIEPIKITSYYGNIIDTQTVPDEKIKHISVCDTIHDFGKGTGTINSNSFFRSFVRKYFGSNYFSNKRQKTNNPVKENSSIENHIFKYLNIQESKDYKYVHEIDEVDIKDKSFTIRTDDIREDDFRLFISSVCKTTTFNGDKLEFILDANILPREAICELKKIQQTNILISEATIYDRRLESSSCNKNKSIEAVLQKKYGNLFGLEHIKVFQKDGKNMLEYSYQIKENKKNQNLKINTFDINEYTFIQSKMETKYKNLIARIIKDMSSDTGRNYENSDKSMHRKSKLQANTESFETNMEPFANDIKKVNGLDYEDFKNLDNGEQILVSCLFDFKRAGDQLQVESCKNEKKVFISGDRVAIAYAYQINVPCIKVSSIQSDGPTNLLDTNALQNSFDDTDSSVDNDSPIGNKESSKTKKYKLSFYCFEKTAVITALKDASYILSSIENKLKKMEYYIQLLYLISKYDDIEIIVEKIKNSISFSKTILTYDVSRVHLQNTRFKNSDTKIYGYKYNLRFNVLLQEILRRICDDSMKYSTILTGLTAFENKCKNLKENNPDKSECKELLDDILKNETYLMADMIYLCNEDYSEKNKVIKMIIIHLLGAYNSDSYELESETQTIFTNADENTKKFNQYMNIIYNFIEEGKSIPILEMFRCLLDELKPSQTAEQIDKNRYKYKHELSKFTNDSKTIVLTLNLYQHFKNDRKMKNIVDNLITEMTKHRRILKTLLDFDDEELKQFILGDIVQQYGGKYTVCNKHKGGMYDDFDSYYSIFLKGLNVFYNNDFVKILIIFFANTYDIFTKNGDFTPSFANFYKDFVQKQQNSMKLTTATQANNIHHTNLVKKQQYARKVARATHANQQNSVNQLVIENNKEKENIYTEQRRQTKIRAKENTVEKRYPIPFNTFQPNTREE